MVSTLSRREAGTVRLLMVAALEISSLASSVLPLLNNHLADSGINLIEKRKVTVQRASYTNKTIKGNKGLIHTICR